VNRRVALAAVWLVVVLAAAVALPALLAQYARWTSDRAPELSASGQTPGPTLPPPLTPLEVSGAFEDPGELVTSWGPVTLRVERPAELVLPSGQIAAADAFFVDGDSVLATLPSGRYPVELLVARSDDGDERIAAARVVAPGTQTGSGLTWEPALFPGQDPSTLAPGEFFGYGVDSGTGSFFGPEAGALASGPEEYEAFADQLLDLLDDHQRLTWSWAELVLDEATGANVVAFSSGFGDGAYPSFVGRHDSRAVAFMTDFLILDTP
jgi:hypothetical protein